jgi:UDP-2,4-diacetamido-2,4,6-trideoxy-beta-L-altropyranose hydrolase
MDVTDQLLKLRKVRQEDCELLWNWVNDPTVRAASFSSDLVSWEEHIQWFKIKLNCPNCYIFIALDSEDNPIGVTRFEIDGNLQAVISTSIKYDERGKGYGKLMIKLAIQELCKNETITKVHAFIRSDNISSIGLFKNVGFYNVRLKIVDSGTLAAHYIYEII